MIAQF